MLAGTAHPTCRSLHSRRSVPGPPDGIADRVTTFAALGTVAPVIFRCHHPLTQTGVVLTPLAGHGEELRPCVAPRVWFQMSLCRQSRRAPSDSQPPTTSIPRVPATLRLSSGASGARRDLFSTAQRMTQPTLFDQRAVRGGLVCMFHVKHRRAAKPRSRRMPSAAQPPGASHPRLPATLRLLSGTGRATEDDSAHSPRPEGRHMWSGLHVSRETPSRGKTMKPSYAIRRAATRSFSPPSACDTPSSLRDLGARQICSLPRRASPLLDGEGFISGPICMFHVKHGRRATS